MATQEQPGTDDPQRTDLARPNRPESRFRLPSPLQGFTPPLGSRRAVDHLDSVFAAIPDNRQLCSRATTHRPSHPFRNRRGICYPLERSQRNEAAGKIGKPYRFYRMCPGSIRAWRNRRNEAIGKMDKICRLSGRLTGMRSSSKSTKQSHWQHGRSVTDLTNAHAVSDVPVGDAAATTISRKH
jgi:hypothetical protein